MGLFDFFKKKPSHIEKISLAYQCYKQELVGMVYPGGLEQANLVLLSLARLLKIDITKLGAKEYYDVLTIYSGVLVRKVVTHSTHSAIVASLMVNHGKYIKNENLAKKTLAFCTLNMKDHTFGLLNDEGMDTVITYATILSQSEETAKENEEIQDTHIDDDEYGLIPSKPIYTVGVSGSKLYLSKLQTDKGETITWSRLGSKSVPNVNGMVDIYSISKTTGEHYKTIYINMYGTAISKVAPKGFQIVE